jgi:hypothetical protein
MSKAKSTKSVQVKTIKIAGGARTVKAAVKDVPKDSDVDDTSLESKVDELLDAVERMTSANDRIAVSMERIADMTDKINEFLEDPERCRTAGIPICIQHINGYVLDNTFDKVISVKIEDPVKITNPDNEYLDVGSVKVD